MTPRQRILTALNHEPPDRTPTDGWFHHEVIDALKQHYGTDDWSVVLSELGIEGWVDLSPQVVSADGAEEANLETGHASGRPFGLTTARTKMPGEPNSGWAKTGVIASGSAVRSSMPKRRQTLPALRCFRRRVSLSRRAMLGKLPN